jgi:cysteinyl-tRNA synthetase
MDDDLNTPRALASLFDMARSINRGKEDRADVKDAQATLKELGGVLGLTFKEEESGEGSDAGPFIQMLVDLRSELRAAKQFDLADSIRDRLTEAGVTLEDGASGTEWQLG